MENQWHYHTFSTPGNLHNRRSIPNQDRYCCLEIRDSYCAVLADGTGKTALNSLAGARVTSVLAHYLLKHEHRIRDADRQTVAKNIMLQIQRTLDDFCAEYLVDQKELSSTFLALQVNAIDDTYTLMHLGDGVAAAGFVDHTIHILSQPENGNRLNQTVLTTSETALGNLRIQNGSAHNIHSFLLATDGVYNGTHDICILEKIFRNPQICDTIGNKEDDQSVILLTRTSY